jgi:hypothetical protein
MIIIISLYLIFYYNFYSPLATRVILNYYDSLSFYNIRTKTLLIIKVNIIYLSYFIIIYKDKLGIRGISI